MTTRRSFLAYGAGAVAAMAAPRIALAGKMHVPTVSDIDGPIMAPTGWGVCVPPQQGAAAMLAALNLLQPARWHGYGTWPDVAYPGRIPMIYSAELFERATVAAWLEDNPGLTWMLPNEPERPEQAAMTWQQAVDMTLEFENMARVSGNPYRLCSPAVAIGMTDYDGLAWLTNLMTNLRQYHNHWRYAYWCVHPYRSSTLAQFRSSWARWLDWYAVYGSGAQTVISEVCGENAPVSVQMQIMAECRAMLDRGEVAGVYWYAALNTPAGSPWPNAMLTSAGALTDLGRHWRSLR